MTLNALALYFILEIDDDLVDDDDDMNSIRTYQKEQLRDIVSEDIFKSKRLGMHASRRLGDTEEVISSQFFVMVSHLTSSFAIFLLTLGAIWMICEPFVLGWTVSDDYG